MLVAFGLIVIVMLSSFINRVIIAPPVDSKIEEGANSSENDLVIQVNVLNACGETGLAAKAMEFLRLRGFDVVEIGNYPKKEEKSLVLDRLGDLRSARKVAYAMGIPDTLVVSAVDSNLFVRSTVVIGKDFPLLKPFN